MYALYKELKPNDKIVSYEYYRKEFEMNFNISFGYPRCDTCSTCDKHQAELKVLNLELQNKQNDIIARKVLLEKMKKMTTEQELHLRKAKAFYCIKRKAAQLSKTIKEEESIAMDFQKNLCIPNLSTNDVYYRRHLSFFLFNVHSLSTGRAIFYSYPETEGKKGADEVVSMLHNYLFTKLDKQVKHLKIFCDSCAGQNKNYTLIRFCHYVVSILKKLDSIKVVFPIRGHSYLECERDMALINQNFAAELPEDWVEHIRTCRTKPPTYEVVEADLPLFRKWTEFLSKYYLVKRPFATRPVREIRFLNNHQRLVEHRASYNGYWQLTPLITTQKLKLMSLQAVKFASENDESTCFNLPPQIRLGE